MAYITLIEDTDKILKVVKQESLNSRHILQAVKERFKLRPRVRLNHMNIVEYPSLEENPEILQILMDMDEERISAQSQQQITPASDPNSTTPNFKKHKSNLLLKD